MPKKAPLTGVALLAAVGAGAYGKVEEACAATIKTVSEKATDRKARRYYDRAFPVYQGLYQSLKKDFVKISEL